MDNEQAIEDLLRQLTLKEKISLLSGRDMWSTVAVPRLGIPSIVMTDGPNGVRATNIDEGRLVGPTTAFPTGVAMAATWNPALIEEVGQALGEEARAMGCDVLLGPCVNIARYPLGGRNFETYSEDPFLAGRTAVAFVRGVQSRGVGTSLKHYALNNYESERTRASSRAGERAIREIYLLAFEMAVKEASPWTVMCSYNRINGIYASEHEHMLKEILKGKWGFDGAVISDWGAVHSEIAPITNGLDLEMPGPAKYFRLLEEAVQNWQIDEAAVDEAARRVLRLILRVRAPNQPAGAVNTPSHQLLARRVAEESITLLQNQDGVLPIDPARVKTLAVVGPNAATAVISGGGSARVEPPYTVAPLDALIARLPAQVALLYERGCGNNEGDAIDPQSFQRAVALAQSADAVLYFGGMPEGYEREGDDRPNMRLPGSQDCLISALASVNPNTVVILTIGAPVEMPWYSNVAAIVVAYYAGQEGGNAVAEVLLGEVNPSGKLPVTFPVRLQDSPAYINASYPGVREVYYGEGIFVGYRYFDYVQRLPLFPFGHGLSYTTFSYSDLELPAKVEPGEAISISLKVTNTGPVAGKEVVQLYISDPLASVPRPYKELKGFAKVALSPGETQTVTFTLDARALSYYSLHEARWVVEPGQFDVIVGRSSLDLRLLGHFTLG